MSKRAHHGKLTTNDLDNPVNEPGYWTKASKFTGRKSFGAYKCERCHALWISAHAFKQYTQDCKRCESAYLPKYMWVNSELNKQDKKVRELDRSKPHDAARCEACQAGVCDGGHSGRSRRVYCY